MDNQLPPATTGDAIKRALELRWLDPAIDVVGTGIGNIQSAIQNALNNPQHRWFSPLDMFPRRVIPEELKPTIQPAPQNPPIPNVDMGFHR